MIFSEIVNCLFAIFRNLDKKDMPTVKSLKEKIEKM